MTAAPLSKRAIATQATATQTIATQTTLATGAPTGPAAADGSQGTATAARPTASGHVQGVAGSSGPCPLRRLQGDAQLSHERCVQRSVREGFRSGPNALPNVQTGFSGSRHPLGELWLQREEGDTGAADAAALLFGTIRFIARLFDYFRPHVFTVWAVVGRWRQPLMCCLLCLCVL